MRKNLIRGLAIVLILGLAGLGLNMLSISEVKADVQVVTLSTSVQSYLSFSITAGDEIPFGNLTPGTPINPATSTDTSVTTNAANGYTLKIHDGSDTNAALRHTDTTTWIADYAGTITTPTSWTGTGLGFCLFVGTNKDAKWGTGTTAQDANNKYAGAPAAATTIMTKTGYSSGADTAKIAWEIDVLNTQKTGSYSSPVGNEVTLTVTAVLE